VPPWCILSLPRYHSAMATTQEILTAAREVGKLIASHDSARKVEAAMAKLQNDVEAQRVLNDYNRHLQKLGEKEQAGKPIEVAEKQQLEKLQNAVIRNPVLRDFQMAQMDYLDLMRKVDEAMAGAPEQQPSGIAQAPAGAVPGAPVFVDPAKKLS
jgi:cell fate (sporulation/competence/biofilm development) regulator YlbF (YheA/YmcA/DUF963 family)